MNALRGFAIAALLAGPALAYGQFVETAAARGVAGYQMADGMAGGIAAADFDSDGDIDIFAPCGWGVPNMLFENDGAGNFTDIGPAAGVASTENSRAALFLDYDSDGDLDLLVAQDCWQGNCPPATTLRLYEQQAVGLFVDATPASGLFGPLSSASFAHFGGMAAGDLDNDGYLDLFVGFWSAEGWLFVNNGDRTFTDISDSAGIRQLGVTTQMHRWQPMIHDFDGDGWQDIFVAVDFDANRLYLNQQDGTFVDVASGAACAGDWNEMGVAVADVENDRDMDIYVTNIWNWNSNGEHNRLYQRDGSSGVLSFVDIGLSTGVGNTGWGWGVTFADYDNDTRLDIAVTNGFGQSAPLDESKLFRNLGGNPPAFDDVSVQVGFNDTEWGSGLIALDSDRDGDLDLLQSCSPGPLRLLENQSGAAAGNYLVVRPRMLGPNSHAIGAVVRVRSGGVVMSRLISAGTSTLSQEPAEAFFGLGTATVVKRVIIRWPNGAVTRLRNVAANQVLTVREPFVLQANRLPFP